MHTDRSDNPNQIEIEMFGGMSYHKGNLMILCSMANALVSMSVSSYKCVAGVCTD